MVSAAPAAWLPPKANWTSAHSTPASFKAWRTAYTPCSCPVRSGVLPNGWIPIPTIAIAHNSGISIITDSPSGVVYDLTANAEANDVAEVAFLADNRYSFATTANNERWWVDDIQTADENQNYFYQRTSYDYSQSNQANMSAIGRVNGCLLYTSPSPRDRQKCRMPACG